MHNIVAVIKNKIDITLIKVDELKFANLLKFKEINNKWILVLYPIKI